MLLLNELPLIFWALCWVLLFVPRFHFVSIVVMLIKMVATQPQASLRSPSILYLFHYSFIVSQCLLLKTLSLQM